MWACGVRSTLRARDVSPCPIPDDFTWIIHGRALLSTRPAGWLFFIVRLLGFALAIGVLVAYVSGASDTWTRQQTHLAVAMASTLAGALVVSALAYLRFRSDDEMVGDCLPVPFEMLMDQRRHTLHLPICAPQPTPPEEAEAPKSPDDTSSAVVRALKRSLSGRSRTLHGGVDHGKRNSAGDLGVLKVRLELSER